MEDFIYAAGAIAIGIVLLVSLITMIGIAILSSWDISFKIYTKSAMRRFKNLDRKKFDAWIIRMQKLYDSYNKGE